MTPEQILSEEVFTIQRSDMFCAGLRTGVAEAGYRIVPTVDDETRREVEALITAIRAMRPDPNEPCPPGWDSDDRQGDRNIYRSAELLAAAYLPPPRLTDASYSGRTYK